MTWIKDNPADADPTSWTWEEAPLQHLRRKGDVFVELFENNLFLSRSNTPGVHDPDWPLNVTTLFDSQFVPGGAPTTEDAARQAIDAFVATLPDEDAPEDPPGGEG